MNSSIKLHKRAQPQSSVCFYTEHSTADRTALEQ